MNEDTDLRTQTEESTDDVLRDLNIVRSWASIIDDATMAQAEMLSRSPVLAGPVALMPDAHLGKGATIGSVIPTEAAIIPAAVGVDLGCGMIATETDLTADTLPDSLNAMLGDVEAHIPAGFHSHDDPLDQAAEWMAAHPLSPGTTAEERDLHKAVKQLGTLGGGNHFVEMATSQQTGRVWLVLHSGSRGIGNALASRHIHKARDLAEEAGRALEDPDLAYFLASDAEFTAYISDMLWAQRYAMVNREIMMGQLLGVARKHLPEGFQTLRQINCHHNYCEREHHGGRDVWVTRKGAIRAARGELGIIPGSMGAATYIVSGKGNSASYNSASHGAGRLMSRNAARKRITTQEFREAMKGRTWQERKALDLLDEAPNAYKPIDQVMEDQEDLVEVVDVVTAVLNYKGTK